MVNFPKLATHITNIAVKLDLSKVFAIIEWPLVIDLLQKYHFPPPFIFLIQHCITSTNISIRYNNTKTPYFHPTRGLRQGDPLSPLLFILYIQGLSAIISDSLVNNRWKPIILKHQPLVITYLAFTDDLILFWNGTNEWLQELLNELQNFSTTLS